MQFLCDYVSSGRTGKQVSPPSTKGPLFSCHCIWIIQKPWCFKRECLPQAQVFEHLASGWLCCVGTLWNFKRQSLVGGRALVPPVFEFIAWPCYQFTFFFFALSHQLAFYFCNHKPKQTLPSILIFCHIFLVTAMQSLIQKPMLSVHK